MKKIVRVLPIVMFLSTFAIWILSATCFIGCAYDTTRHHYEVSLKRGLIELDIEHHWSYARTGFGSYAYTQFSRSEFIAMPGPLAAFDFDIQPSKGLYDVQMPMCTVTFICTIGAWLLWRKTRRKKTSRSFEIMTDAGQQNVTSGENEERH
jgi:hypothetical protein